ncbi:MAG: hypothetical protein H0X35_08155 [Pseudonocardiales bacterium]|nr:hypothetical protein [Pseudonocardiales bacterium]
MTAQPTAAPPATWSGPRLAAPAIVAAIALAVTGPLAVAVLRVVMPYDTPDDDATIAAKVAAHPGSQAAVLGLTYLALLALPLGIVLGGAAAVRARPVLGGIGATVAWLGFMSLFASVGYDTIAFAGARAGVPVPVVAQLGAALDADPVTSVATTMFIAGHILGVILLAAALWSAVPRWAAVALAVSQPLHLVFAVVVPNHPLDGLAWLLTAVGFGAAVLAGTRTVRGAR